MELAEKFFARFPSLERVVGRTIEKSTTTGKGKREASSWLERERLTVDHWRKHLTGEIGVGLVPIRDDATCAWGAIDVDDYEIELSGLVREVRNLHLPLVVCRTKSGGAHLFLFLSEPAPAELVRGKLMEWAVALGHAGVEVFPKQVQLASKNDVGSYLNMPYFGGEATTRYAVVEEGGIGPEEFLELARMRQIDVERLQSIQVSIGSELDELLFEAPPCLQTLARRGFPEGTRNNSLFNLAIYMKKRFPDDWKERVDEINSRLMEPPMGHKEVSGIVKSVDRKEYVYRCSEPPISSCCNRQICLTRTYGIGEVGEVNVSFGRLTKIETDPVIWIWDVNGVRVELSTEQLTSAKALSIRVLEACTVLVTGLTQKKLAILVSEGIKDAEILKPSEDLTEQGALVEHLDDFCTSNFRARTRDEILLGKPFTEDGRTLFRSRDFVKYLDQKRVRGITKPMIYKCLRQLGGKEEIFREKGKIVRAWSIPEFHVQTEEHDVPRAQGGEF